MTKHQALKDWLEEKAIAARYSKCCSIFCGYIDFVTCNYGSFTDTNDPPRYKSRWPSEEYIDNKIPRSYVTIENEYF